MGFLTGFAFALFCASLGVGIGEAGGTPASHSLIADYFSPEKRTTALSIPSTGTHVGILIGMVAGA